MTIGVVSGSFYCVITVIHHHYGYEVLKVAWPKVKVKPVTAYCTHIDSMVDWGTEQYICINTHTLTQSSSELYILDTCSTWNSGLYCLIFSNHHGCHGSGKSQGKNKFFKVREKSGNFDFIQGKWKPWKKSGNSDLGQGKLGFYEHDIWRRPIPVQ